jgi:phosphopantothenoylcysteine decarboxylase/phosphopantothenate--cysteine ligase
VANDITDKNNSFSSNTNKVTIISRKGKVESLPILTKKEVADRILDKVVGILDGKA